MTTSVVYPHQSLSEFILNIGSSTMCWLLLLVILLQKGYHPSVKFLSDTIWYTFSQSLSLKCYLILRYIYYVHHYIAKG